LLVRGGVERVCVPAQPAAAPDFQSPPPRRACFAVRQLAALRHAGKENA